MKSHAYVIMKNGKIFVICKTEEYAKQVLAGLEEQKKELGFLDTYEIQEADFYNL